MTTDRTRPRTEPLPVIAAPRIPDERRWGTDTSSGSAGTGVVRLPRVPPATPPRTARAAEQHGARVPSLTRIGSVFGRAGRRWSIRSRVLSALLALSALGLVVAGVTAYTLQRAALTEDMDSSLERSFGEFENLLATGINPATRGDFVSAETLVYLVMQRTLPAPNEGMMGVRDGRAVLLANDTVPLRLEADPELIGQASAATLDDTVRITSIDTAMTTYRAMVVPVRLSADAEPTMFVLAYDSDAEHAELNRTFATFALISVGTLLLVGAVGWLLLGNLLHPVRRLRDTARKIGDTDLSRRIVVTGNDDLSDLTRTFNAMLDRLETSFRSQRQLLDDVGHELRTPITIIQGHLELQDGRDPDDVESVRAVALDELERMRFLVDDLVTLAGSARPDFVRTEPTDVGRLTDDVLDKARGLGARRWIIDSRADTVVDLDPRRTTQALLQLAANAVKFSSEASTIAIGSHLEGGDVSLWVRDEGAGISASDQEKIFGRFERGAGGRRAEGSGLGLAIVKAIAEAHGGSVTLLSAPGRGSTFTLVLPAAPPAVDGRDRTTVASGPAPHALPVTTGNPTPSEAP